ncbi:MAG: M48 family metalloprotease [Pseudomonadota bacterium]
MELTPHRPTGLFGWVQSNNFRSASYFLAFATAAQILAATVLFVPLALFNEAFSPLYGPLGYLSVYVPIILIGTLAMFAMQMLLYTSNAQKQAGFIFVDASDEPRLCSVTEHLLAQIGMPAPFVAVLESPAMNAYACGVSQTKSILVVTRGLLDGLNDAELEAVLAHELTHIKNNDIRLMAAANICVANLRWMHKWNPLHFRNAIHGVICVGFPVFFPLMILGGLISQLAIRGAYGSRLIISASREFVADAEAARITHNPASLASALYKVQDRYRINGARDEDEAMMIAGDSEGPTASHPQIDERVSALAQTTGSMVFNAPGAHESSRRERFRREAAGGSEKGQRQSVFARIGAVTGENIFGLTAVAKWILLGALAFSLVWQGTSLLNPSAVLDKMDVRQFGHYLGTDTVHCLFEREANACFEAYPRNFSQFGDQQGTLLGFLTDRKEARQAEEHSWRENEIAEESVMMRDYTGQSGLMRDYQAMMGRDGRLFFERTSRVGPGVPTVHIYAELQQVGCFDEHLIHGKNSKAEFSTTDRGGGVDFSKYAPELTLAARTALNGGDDALMDYARTRRTVVRIAFDLFGSEGLAAIQQTLKAQLHKDVEAKLAIRLLSDPGFATEEGKMGRAELEALATKPARYVPCIALKSAPAKPSETKESAETSGPIFGDYKPER